MDMRSRSIHTVHLSVVTHFNSINDLLSPSRISKLRKLSWSIFRIIVITVTFIMLKTFRRSMQLLHDHANVLHGYANISLACAGTLSLRRG